MRHLLRLIGILSLTIAAPAMAAPSEQEFVLDMLVRFRTAFPTAQFSQVPDDPLSLAVKGGPDLLKDGTINLQRIYGYCQTAAPADCQRTEAEFIAKISQPLPAEHKDNLRIIVRDRQYRDYYLGIFKDQPARSPVSRQIGEDLFAILAFDAPETIELANLEMLGKQGLTADQAWALAAAQTAKIIPAAPTPEQMAKGEMEFQADGYLATMLVQNEAWERLAKAIGPNLFVTVVSDNFVFVGTLPGGPDLDRFAKAVDEDCKAQQRCVSPHIYRWRDGKWVIAR